MHQGIPKLSDISGRPILVPYCRSLLFITTAPEPLTREYDLYLGKDLIRIGIDTIFSMCRAGAKGMQGVLESRGRELFSVFLADELGDIPS